MVVLLAELAVEERGGRGRGRERGGKEERGEGERKITLSKRTLRMMYGHSSFKLWLQKGIGCN